MRLLNSETKTLETFSDRNIPDYAILSHTWGDGEVSFQDIQDESKASDMEGYKKIQSCCNQARQDGYDYVWIDTCCINKESSAELSEAINSMYLWYQNAQVCYVYLVDVPSDEDPNSEGSSFVHSRWFTRGWTLQELVAPLSLIFYANDWVEIGTKASLQDIVSTVTGMEKAILLTNHPGEISIAKRMSWAANRDTERKEDIAYCLMGIFGVNMPTIYGEGENAFIRLQREIIKLSDDQTIFAWQADGWAKGLLARSPAAFVNAGDIRTTTGTYTSEYSVTNTGLRINLPLRPVPNADNTFLAVLNCQYGYGGGSLAIYLKREQGQQFARINTNRMEVADGKNITPEIVYIQEKDPARFAIEQRMRPEARYDFSVNASLDKHGFSISETYPSDSWDKGMHLSIGGSGTSGTLVFQNETGEKFAVTLGVHNYGVWTDVVTDFGNETAQSIRDSYYTEGGRGGQLWRNLDRISASLKEGKLVSVSIRKRRIAKKTDYMAEIVIKAESPLSFKNTYVRPGSKYTFIVKTTISEHRLAISEAIPSDFWDEERGGMRLSMNGSGTSGIIMFKDKTEEKFAVMLGVHNYKVWTDVVTDFGNETTQSIRDSYYREGGRGATLWLNRTDSFASLCKGGSVSVSVSVNPRIPVYATKITVK